MGRGGRARAGALSPQPCLHHGPCKRDARSAHLDQPDLAPSLAGIQQHFSRLSFPAATFSRLCHVGWWCRGAVGGQIDERCRVDWRGGLCFSYHVHKRCSAHATLLLCAGGIGSPGSCTPNERQRQGWRSWMRAVVTDARVSGPPLSKRLVTGENRRRAAVRPRSCVCAGPTPYMTQHYIDALSVMADSGVLGLALIGLIACSELPAMPCQAQHSTEPHVAPASWVRDRSAPALNTPPSRTIAAHAGRAHKRSRHDVLGWGRQGQEAPDVGATNGALLAAPVASLPAGYAQGGHPRVPGSQGEIGPP